MALMCCISNSKLNTSSLTDCIYAGKRAPGLKIFPLALMSRTVAGCTQHFEVWLGFVPQITSRLNMAATVFVAEGAEGTVRYFQEVASKV